MFTKTTLLFKSQIIKRTTLNIIMIFLGLNINAQGCFLTGWKKISEGETFSVALKQDGTIWVWGQNISGILGDGSGTTTILEHPTQMGTDTDWVDIAVGRWFILAKKSNNDLYGWGDNDYGNLGNGNNTDQYTPILMESNVASFSAGYHHSMIVKTDGTMWGTGYNDWGCLGMGTSVGWYNTWQQESSLATDWAKTSAGYYNSFGIKTDGTLWSCGTNIEGQTGTGATSGESDVFVQIGTDTDWDEVSCGVYHVLGLKTTGELFGWGYSANGRLGIVNAGAQYFRTPQAIEATSSYTHIATSWDGSAIIKDDGTLYTFGVNHGGTTGTTGDTNNLAPQQVGTDSDWNNLALRVGGYHFGAVKNDSSIWSWGTDNLYQLGNGDGTPTDSNVPTQVTCEDLLGTNNFAENTNFSVYPNPTQDLLYLNLNSSQEINEVKIYSIQGALIKTVSKVKEGKAINISDLSAGIYILKVDDKSQGIKLIKK